MRSHSFLRKSHLLIQRSPVVHDLQPFLQPQATSALRNRRARPISARLTSNRFLSSNSVPPANEVLTGPSSFSELPRPTEVTAADPSPPPGINEEDKAVPKIRRTRIISSTSSPEAPEFPPGLEHVILHLPMESVTDSALPPPEIFEEALNKLLVTLHPTSQHRAMQAPTASGRSVEPTLGLYCPIEGGDYVIDVAVTELAYQTGAEILLLDSVHLAAGEWGMFGKAATALELPRNPLHLSAPSLPPAEATRQAPRRDREEDEDDSPFAYSPPSRMSISLPKAFTSLQGRAIMPSSTRKSISPSKLDVFFENLVNMPFPSHNIDGAPYPVAKNRPRLIYIRDFPTLAPHSSTWYPSLLAAVRQRRRGLLSRSSNTTSSPVAIIFGMTPPLSPQWSEGSSGATSNLMSLLMNRSIASSQMTHGAKHEHFHDWSESDAAELAREKRLRSRLRKWEKNASGLHDEFPRLSTRPEGGEASSNPDIIVIGSPVGSSGVSPMDGMSIGIGIMDDSDASSKFFRSSILVPKTRSLPEEREARIARRREINEITMKMAVGAVGGIIESSPTFSEPELESEPEPEMEEGVSKGTPSPMWEEWGNKIETWASVRKVADSALGSVMASEQALSLQDKATLSPTVVPWASVESAWTSCHSLLDARKAWLKEAVSQKPFAEDSPETEETLSDPGTSSDKVVEGLKNDPDLDQHQARLLPCIVDTGSIITTFNQVHLPGHTIDSVRTMVSLPLLHPRAFQQGILKEHSMTGCLLFGPPGTGKTLIVRALAKEAGCRMLAISPSDVMDMYVGEGEKLVRAVFALARRLSPCVVFLDEIDALFGARMSARESGSAFAHRGVITEFMQEMDGLKSSKDDNVIVIGATNRPFDLDDAVLRRLPRRLLVDLPGEKERAEILKILLRDEKLAYDVDIDTLAKKADSFSGSDLKHLCVSAALDAVKEHMEVPWLVKDASVSPIQGHKEPSLAANEHAEPTSGGVAFEQSTSPASDPLSVKDTSASPEIVHLDRILHLRNFTKALKEITPSSSELLGSLAELRKWNEEFGEGRKDKKKRQVWGKGRFGFVDAAQDSPESA
ncbi:unnamed protein product [Cyclocybe aegerita]|uniref:AAA+ ATPase domain-containing protein n=1 Tax=Cyclocybe aegerita TaxID=1973307 RepID=A0A8S0X9U4_CYCAE|nr:unnamed protein product [Cyclocybe aegerita]